MNNYNFHYFSFQRPNSHYFHRNYQPKNISINNRYDYGYNLSSNKYNNNNTSVSNFRDYSNEKNRYNFRAGSITERYQSIFDNNNNARVVFFNNNNYYENGMNNSYNYSMKKNYYINNNNNNVNISSENYNSNFRINNNFISNYYTNNNNNNYSNNNNNYNSNNYNSNNYSFNNYNKIPNIKRFYTNNNNNNNNLNELNYNNNNNLNNNSNNNLNSNNNNNHNNNNNNNNINNIYINSYINKNNPNLTNTNTNTTTTPNILTSILQNFPSNNLKNTNNNIILHDKYLSPYSSKNPPLPQKPQKLKLSQSQQSLQKYYLPPQSTPKKTLILDLDETLVHSSFKSISADITLQIPSFNNKILKINVLKRPFLDEFLSTFSNLFEIVIFTSSVSEYANPLLNELDPNKKIFKFRLFREHCVFMSGIYIKDLSKIGRNLKNCVIIDNNPISFVANKENGIPIKSFHYDKNDFELKRIKKLLFLIADEKIKDVRKVIKNVVKNNQIDFDEVDKIYNKISNKIHFKKVDFKEKNKNFNVNKSQIIQNPNVINYRLILNNNNNNKINNKSFLNDNNNNKKKHKIQINNKLYEKIKKINNNFIQNYNKNNNNRFSSPFRNNNINNSFLIENINNNNKKINFSMKIKNF